MKKFGAGKKNAKLVRPTIYELNDLYRRTCDQNISLVNLLRMLLLLIMLVIKRGFSLTNQCFVTK